MNLLFLLGVKGNGGCYGSGYKCYDGQVCKEGLNVCPKGEENLSLICLNEN